MIKNITVTNYLGESLLLELMFPENSGFVIKEITGLGPSKAVINSTELSTSDGSVFNSSRIESRNIVFNLKILASPTIEAARQKLYKYFPIKKRIKLQFETDTRICDIFGYVETNEVVIFSNQVSTQISVICPDPYFYSAGSDAKTVTLFSGVEAAFEFPFSNESLTLPLLVFGEIRLDQERNIYYNGDSETGLTIYIHALGEATNLTIYNIATSEFMKIDTVRLTTLTGFPIIAGDDIIISTIKGCKYISLLRGGSYINILNCLDLNSTWFQLTKGDNQFGFVAETGETTLQFRVENYKVFEGI
mgnify:CR=1 FL=1